MVSGIVVVCVGCGIILAFLRDESKSAWTNKMLFVRLSSVYPTEKSPGFHERVRGTPLGVRIMKLTENF